MQLDEFSKPQLVTLAVALLGGDVDYVDREDIAIKVNELAPGRFNWRKYPKQIDLEVVGVSLRDAKKAKNGTLLSGGNIQGWMLSPAGLRWVRTIDLSVFEDTETKYRKGSASAKMEEERLRLSMTRAYELFTDGETEAITVQDFYQFARINEYFQTKSRWKRYAIIENAVLDHKNLTELWQFLKGKFEKEME